MIEVPILKDIRTYKTKVVGPFSGREIICAAIAVGCAYASYFVQTDIFHMEKLNGYLTLFAALPGALFGWVKPYGLKFETYLKSVFIDSVLAPNVRPYKPENPYYDLLKLRTKYKTDDEEAVEETEPADGKKKKVKPKDLPYEWYGGK